MNYLPRMALIIVTGAVFGAVGAAQAGQISGRVVQGVRQARMGSSAWNAIGAATQKTAGPILVYVGEAESELPRHVSTDTRITVSAAQMNPALQAVSVGSTIRFELAGIDAVRVESEHGAFALSTSPTSRHRSLRMKTVGVYSLRARAGGALLGQIVVLPHSAFAVTDAAGSFTFPDLPSGKVTVVAYSSERGEISRRVRVPETGKVDVQLTF